MKLTENEKREILKALELDRPLPDKYRFLLFDDKREVEFVWNGKTNEVTNIVLPFQLLSRWMNHETKSLRHCATVGMLDLR